MKPRVIFLLTALAAMLSLVEPAFAQRNLNVTAAAANEQRVALVIGNSAYKVDPLKNPANDAEDVAAALRALGFRVTLRKDASHRQMIAAVNEFGQELKKGGVGLFYYAGHGVQSRGRNYLIPVGAKVGGEADLEFESVDANRVLAYMEDAGNRVNIVIMDACRNNPYARSFRSSSRGLAPMDAAKGSFLAYATAPGSVAADGSGRNGLYTQHLLASLRQTDSDIDKVFRRVTAEVSRTTGGKQVPWVSSSLTGDFYFREGTQVATVAPSSSIAAPANPAADDRAFWDSIKDSRDPEEFKAYLEQFPDGLFAPLAKARVQTLIALANPPPVRKQEPALVYIFRRSGTFGDFNPDYAIKVRGNTIGSIPRIGGWGKDFIVEYRSPPGELELTADGGSRRSTSVFDLESGKTYYVELVGRTAQLRLVDEATGAPFERCFRTGQGC